MKQLFLALTLIAAAVLPSASAQSFNAQQGAEIRALVRDYLVNNPDVLREALAALQARVDAQRRVKAETDPRDFSIGARNAPITMVEFFDYRCPYCQAALPSIVDLVHRRHDIRFVFKEMPLSIHGQPALEATEASVAAMPQGHYWQFHQALMAFRGDLTSDQINSLAAQSGIDVARMRRAMSNPAIMKLIDDNSSLANDLGAQGTPAFLINGQLVPGFAPDLISQKLQEAGDQARLHPRT
jgi:protein-disulfide isomerase